jgi:PAS domain-containing protein
MVRMVGMTVVITERKLAEREHVLTSDRLRLAMESGKSVGWDRDVKNGRDSLFGDLRSVFGIPSEVFDGQVEDFHRYLHPEDRGRSDRLRNGDTQAIRGGVPPPLAGRTVRWLAAKGQFYYSRDGEPERKLAEEALPKSEERLLLTIQAGRMYAFEWDAVTT